MKTLKFIAVVLLAGCAVSPQVQRARQIAPRELTSSERQIIGESVSQALVDPNSAMFAFLPLRSPDGYCGVVNARNRLGGYAGQALFLVKPIWRDNMMRAAVLVGVDRGSQVGSVGVMCSQMGLLPQVRE